MSNKDYICLHCARKNDGKCKYEPNENTVTCGSFWPKRVDYNNKEFAKKARTKMNKLYGNGGSFDDFATD